MPTPVGIAFVVTRLSAASDMETLRRVWGDIADAYRELPQVKEHKDWMKAELSK